MMTLRVLPGYPIPASAVWLLTDIAEHKGRHQLFARQSPQALKALLQMALVQSAESSNRIEGVTVEPARLRPLVLGSAKPRDRSEREVRGYRRALDLIHGEWQKLGIGVPTVRRLHVLAQDGSGDAGRWKATDNEIVELRPGKPPVVRFRPVSAQETPEAMEELCLGYGTAIEQAVVPPLVAVAALILDFLCIHPFRDGNGRVSRLLTLLALYQHGHAVGRYVSTERLVEDSKEDYYEALRRSSQGWHEGKHDFAPWLAFFLSIVRRAYAEFEQRAGDVRAPRGAKTQLVEATIAGFEGAFSLADLERRCPGVSRDMVRRVLGDLRRKGLVICRGRGPAARWERTDSTLKRGY
jgi:Fic family protein